MNIISKDKFLFCKTFPGRDIVSTIFGGDEAKNAWFPMTEHNIDKPRSEKFTGGNMNAFLSLFEAFFERLFYVTNGDVPDGYESEFGLTSRELYGFKRCFGFDILEDGDEARMLKTRRLGYTNLNLFLDLVNAFIACKYKLFCSRPSFHGDVEKFFWSSKLYQGDPADADGIWRERPLSNPTSLRTMVFGFAPYYCLDEESAEGKTEWLRWLFGQIKWVDRFGRSALDDIPIYPQNEYPRLGSLMGKVFRGAKFLYDEKPSTFRFRSNMQSALAATLSMFDRCVIDPGVEVRISNHVKTVWTASVSRKGRLSTRATTEGDVPPLILTASELSYDEGNIINSKHRRETTGFADTGFEVGAFAGMKGSFGEIYAASEDNMAIVISTSVFYDAIKAAEELSKGDEYKINIDYSTFNEGFCGLIITRAHEGAWEEDTFRYNVDTYSESSEGPITVEVEFNASITMTAYRTGGTIRLSGGINTEGKFERPCKEAEEDGVLEDARLIFVSSNRTVSDKGNTGFIDYIGSSVGAPQSPDGGAPEGVESYDVYSSLASSVDAVSVDDYCMKNLLQLVGNNVESESGFNPCRESSIDAAFETALRDIDLRYNGYDIVIPLTRHKELLYENAELYFDMKDGEPVYREGTLTRIGGAIEDLLMMPPVLLVGQYSFSGIPVNNPTPEEQLRFYRTSVSSTKTVMLEKLDFKFNHCSHG